MLDHDLSCEGVGLGRHRVVSEPLVRVYVLRVSPIRAGFSIGQKMCKRLDENLKYRTCIIEFDQVLDFGP